MKSKWIIIGIAVFGLAALAIGGLVWAGVAYAQSQTPSGSGYPYGMMGGQYGGYGMMGGYGGHGMMGGWSGSGPMRDFGPRGWPDDGGLGPEAPGTAPGAPWGGGPGFPGSGNNWGPGPGYVVPNWR